MLRSQPAELSGAEPRLSAADGTELPADIKAVRARRPLRLIASAVMLLLGVSLAISFVRNSRVQWDVIRHYMFARPILDGVLVTLELTVLSMVIGAVLGVILATARLSGSRIIRSGASLYIWAFRGTPVLVQVLLWYNLAALYPQLSFGIPFGPTFVHGSANSLISAFTASLLALGLNEGAYMAEIVRAGILSVDPGQTEAARAIGMTNRQAMAKIVLPQAMRVIIPPTGNETVGMLKTTSLVSVIAYTELLYSAQLIYSQTFQTIPLLMVVCAWYLLLTSILTVGQRYLEPRFSRGSGAGTTPRPPRRGSWWRFDRRTPQGSR